MTRAAIARESSVQGPIKLVREIPALELAIDNYLSHKRLRLTTASQRGYNATLRTLARFYPKLTLADFEPPEGTRLLEDFLVINWAERAPRTYNKNLTVISDFFRWQVLRERMLRNPVLPIERAKEREIRRQVFTKEERARILAVNPGPRDQIALRLIVRYAMRRGGVANVQMKHFDWDRRLLTVHTKGGRIHTLPIPDGAFWAKLLALQATGLGPDSYLLYRRDSRKRKVSIDEAEVVLALGSGQQQGYAWVTNRFHDRHLAGNSVHRWWYRCLEHANLVPKGTTAGLNMHRGRHTSITAIVRDSGIAVAKQLAGHADIGTTDRYSHLDTGDLAQALTRVYGLGED